MYVVHVIIVNSPHFKLNKLYLFSFILDFVVIFNSLTKLDKVSVLLCRASTISYMILCIRFWVAQSESARVTLMSEHDLWFVCRDELTAPAYTGLSENARDREQHPTQHDLPGHDLFTLAHVSPSDFTAHTSTWKTLNKRGGIVWEEQTRVHGAVVWCCLTKSHAWHMGASREPSWWILCVNKRWGRRE